MHLPAAVQSNHEVSVFAPLISFALSTLVVLAVGAPNAVAQDAAPTAAPITPPGWRWLTDAPAQPQRGGPGGVTPTTFEFSPMAPGWHVTMGPGALLYPGDGSLSGRFALEAVMILFPEPTEAEYGVFVGGSALEGARARWTAFVVRGDGSAAVLQHAAGRTQELLAWTKRAAVVARGESGNARNVIRVRAEPDSVRFLVNEIVVHSWPRSALSIDGQYGMRIGRGVNIHITNVDVTRRLAPFPSR